MINQDKMFKILKTQIQQEVTLKAFITVSAGTHLDVTTHSGQQRRQRFVPIVPQPFAVWSAGVRYKEMNTVHLSDIHSSQ